MPHFTSLAEIMASYPDRFLPAKATDGVIQFDFTGEGGAPYHMLIQDGALQIEPGVHPDPTVTVIAPAADWIRVNNGEANPMGLLMQGKLKVKGSLAMATRFTQMFVPGHALP